MAEQFVRSIYHYNELSYYLYSVANFLQYNGRIIHSNGDTHKLQLFAAVVTSAPTEKSKLIKFDLKVKMKDDVRLCLEMHCGKFSTTTNIIDGHTKNDMENFIHYNIYRCLEDSLKPPYRVIEKKFFLYTSDEELSEGAIGLGVYYYYHYRENPEWISHGFENTDWELLEIPSLNCMTDVIPDVLEKYKSSSDISADDLLALETISEKRRTDGSVQTWQDHLDSFTSMTMFMAIIAKYMP
jgi:hypothetical protein